MNAFKRTNYYLRLIIPVGITVIFLIAGFFKLAETVMLDLSKDKMTYKSENYADYINIWTETILNELGIYKNTLEKEGELSEHSFKVLSTSYGPHSEFPFGLYWGDANGNFYDCSGWDPGPEYVPSSRSWFIEGLQNKSFSFGEPYIDVRTDRPCVSATVKIDIGNVDNVLAADIYFDYADKLVDRIAAQEIETAFFVSGKSKMIVADSDSSKTGLTMLEDVSGLYRSIGELIDSGYTGFTRVQDDEIYCVNISKIKNVDWYFVTCMRESTMLKSLHRVIGYIMLIGAISCILIILLTNLASKAFSAADREAKTDSLTGLLNREGFRSAFGAAVKSGAAGGLMLMFDVDNFKMVNDHLGHTEGDEFLKSFASMFGDFFNRGGDIPARLGGDEFSVFVSRKMSSDEASAMLSKFIEMFHSKFDEKYNEQQLSVSIGAYFVEEDSEDTEKIYKKADEALYKAKNSGKNKFVIS